MNLLFTAVLLIAISYAIVQFGWAICILVAMGTLKLVSMIQVALIKLLATFYSLQANQSYKRVIKKVNLRKR